MIATEGGKVGSTLDAVLALKGILEEVTERAIKGVLAWQIDQEVPQPHQGRDGVADANEPGAARPTPGP